MRRVALLPLRRLIAQRVGARIRELRQDAEMSQQELARRSRTYRPIVGRIERGLHAPDLNTVRELARALELESSVVFGGIDWREVDAAAQASLRGVA